MISRLRVLSIDQALSKGARIITINNRLAKHLRAYSDHRLCASDQPVAASVDVLPFHAWLRHCNEKLVDRGVMRQRLLSSFEEHLLWQAVIGASLPGDSLLRLQPAVQTAATAYRLLVDWQLELPPPITAETAAFVAWRQAFEAECRDQAWLPSARLIEQIIRAVATGELPMPESIAFAGFDEFTPVLQRLVQTLANAGANLGQLAQPAHRGSARRFSARDFDQEIEAAVAWALARQAADAAARIGIVAPNIADIRRPIDERFAHAAPPDLTLHEFSLGLPLSDYPIVADALVALDLTLGKRPQTEVSQFLRSPFVGGAEREYGGRAMFDVVLRRSLRPSYGLAYVHQQLARTAPNAAHSCPHLQRALAGCATLAKALPGGAAPSAWAAAFAEWLECLGWPGDRPLDSTEYQTAVRLQELLVEFARLDLMVNRWSLAEALRYLRELAGATLFQPAGRGAPIQILGLLESAGLEFDHLWVLGLDDEHWPPPAEPNPLLPADLQRRQQLPHASAERERRFAERITQHLLAAAPEVVLSCATHEDDRELRPSPLITGLTVIEPARLGIASLANSRITAANDGVEWVSDDTAPPPAPYLAGGAQLLAAQATCPFSAIARFRLNAASPQTGLQEPDARSQGQLIHRSLELLWRGLGDQATLLRCTQCERETHVRRATHQALREAQVERPDLLGPQLFALEQQRLCGLLEGWLGLEAERAAFEVCALETRQDVTLGKLTLKIRGDRVDRLADGRQVIIDYKTGAQISVADWTEERLEQPQVPLYCLTDDQPIAAAAIAQINARRMAWHGLAAAEGLLPDVPTLVDPTLTDWQSLLAHWHRALHQLGNEIAHGHATATPSSAACQYCSFPGLCRLWDSAEPQAGATPDA